MSLRSLSAGPVLSDLLTGMPPVIARMVVGVGFDPECCPVCRPLRVVRRLPETRIGDTGRR